MLSVLIIVLPCLAVAVRPLRTLNEGNTAVSTWIRNESKKGEGDDASKLVAPGQDEVFQGPLQDALQGKGIPSVTEKLACGAKACTWYTSDPGVVLKVIIKGEMDTEKECQAARAFARQGHHHYATCFAFGEITAADLESNPQLKDKDAKEGNKYLLLERARGKALSQAMLDIRRETHHGLSLAVNILHELANLVFDDQSHLIGGSKYQPAGTTIIHNDLHPDNLYVEVYNPLSQHGPPNVTAIDYDITKTVSNDDNKKSEEVRIDLYRWYATEFLCVLAGDSVQKNGDGIYQFSAGVELRGSSLPDGVKPFFQKDFQRESSNAVMTSSSLKGLAEKNAGGDGVKLFAEKVAPGWIQARLGGRGKEGLSPEFAKELKGNAKAENAMKDAWGTTFWTLQKASNGEAPTDSDFQKLKETTANMIHALGD